MRDKKHTQYQHRHRQTQQHSKLLSMQWQELLPKIQKTWRLYIMFRICVQNVA